MRDRCPYDGDRLEGACARPASGCSAHRPQKPATSTPTGSGRRTTTRRTSRCRRTVGLDDHITDRLAQYLAPQAPQE
jgi:hypothetical protein